MYHLIFPISYCSICLYKGHEQIVHERVKNFTPVFVMIIKYNTLKICLNINFIQQKHSNKTKNI